MTSQIVSDTIDENFPVAGQDNDSQGFRDNFSIIKDGLATAASEITVLQNTTAKLNDANNFSGSLVDNAITNRISGLVFPNGSQGPGTVPIDYNAGEFQTIEVNGTLTLDVRNWPTFDDACSKVTLALTPTQGQAGLASPVVVTLISQGSATIKKNWTSGNDTAVRTVSPGTSTKLFEVFTYDKGETVFIKYIGEFIE